MHNSPIKITSCNNVLVKHAAKIRENSAYRREQGLILVSGYKMIAEISQVSSPLQIFVEDPHQASGNAREIFHVSPQVLKKITGLVKPEGIAALFALPPARSLEHKKLVLICEGIADPGNLGTLMRTALALGFEGIFLIGKGVDPFHERVLSASRGALFKLDYEIGNWARLHELTRAKRSCCLVADIDGEPVDKVPVQNEVFLLLSNESHGVSHEARRFGKKISIPMCGRMESLNVSIAGGILMYSLSRSRVGTPL